MKFTLRARLASALFSTVALLPAQGDARTEAAPIADAILREGTQNSRVMQFQDELCHDIGHRLTGSLAFDRAAAWAVDQFRDMGLDARLEPWGEWNTGWDREQWMGRMVEPSPLELQVACPAWTGGTRGIARGTLVAMPTDAPSLERLVALLDEDGQHWLYGPLPSERNAPELHAAVLALLDRDDVHGIVQSATSTGWNDRRYPNQIRVFGRRNGGLLPFEDRQRWAQAVVRDDQCEQLAAALGGEAPVVVEFELRNRYRRGPIVLNNVVADLVGTEHPDQYVIVCAHLDSWHQATGATDNGTGTCSTLETARILTAVGFRPKRTIRFILWGGEEQGLLGSRQYVVQNRTRMHEISAVFNHDSGTNWAHRLTVAESQREDFEAVIAPIVTAMQPPQPDHEGPVFRIDARDVINPSRGGSDHASFQAVGVPGFSWNLTGPVPYGRGWHSQWDTWSIVVPEFQRHNATVFAVVVAGIADLDHMLSRKGVERSTPNPRSRIDARLIVETWLGVELDGMRITSVSDGGMAQLGGLRAGDQVLEVAGTNVDTVPGLLARLREAAGERETVPVVVVRDGAGFEAQLRP